MLALNRMGQHREPWKKTHSNLSTKRVNLLSDIDTQHLGFDAQIFPDLSKVCSRTPTTSKLFVTNTFWV